MIIIFVSKINKLLPFFCKPQSLILLSIIIICFCSTEVCYCRSDQSETITCTYPGEGSILLKYLIKLASNYFYIACLLSLFLFNPFRPVLKFLLRKPFSFQNYLISILCYLHVLIDCKPKTIIFSWPFCHSFNLIWSVQINYLLNLL